MKKKQKLKICVSISRAPSLFGTYFHNNLYKKYKINAFYKALKIKTDQLKTVFDIVKENDDVIGCSVSTPFKSKSIKYLSNLDFHSRKIRAINTVVNRNGSLIGYNTDFDSAFYAFKKLKINKKNKILIIGSGSMAKVYIYLLKFLKFSNFKICSRKKISNISTSSFIRFKIINNIVNNFDLIINCTTIGMKNNEKKIIFNYNNINKKSKIIDCVAIPVRTPLINYCIKNNILNINGLELAYHQAVRQFKLYTNYNVPKIYKTEFMKFFAKQK